MGLVPPLAIEALLQYARLPAGVFIFARRWAGILLLVGAAGCSSLFPQTKELAEGGLPPGLPPKVELTETPFFPQKEYQCGPAALATVLVGAGVKTTPEALVPQVYIPDRKGSLQVEMLAAARRHGMISYVLAPRFEDVLREIAAGTPVLVLQNLGIFSSGWHYAVAMGYNYPSGLLVLRSGTLERDEMPFAAHEVVWMRSNYWAMVAMPPDRIPATAEERSWLGAVAAFERAGDRGAARVAYQSMLKRWPESIGGHIGLANTHYALGEIADAERVLRAAAAKDPASEVVLNNWAQTLSDLGRQKEALETIDRAAAVGGSFAGEVQKTRAAILERMKK